MLRFDLFVHGCLFIVRLRAVDSDASRRVAELVEAHAAELSQPLVLVLIIGTDCPTPASEAKRQLAAEQQRLGPLCSELRAVILGRELRQALVRSLVTGFAMLPGGPRLELDGCIPEMLTALHQSVALDREWLEDELINAGVITQREASWSSPLELNCG